MARPGRTQKSAAAVDLAGTARTDRPRAEPLPSIPLQNVPDPPTWIEGDTEATKEWKRLAPLLVHDGALAAKDLNTLANLCAVQSRIIRNFRGEDVTAVGCHSTYARYAAVLGLAIGWRMRVGNGGEKDKSDTNPFAAFKSGDRTN